MSKRKKNIVKQEDDMTLVDGYYMPKTIAKHYQQVRDCCIDDLVKLFTVFCYPVEIKLREGVYPYLIATDKKRQKDYSIELSPIHVSQLEKVLGSPKIFEYIKKENKLSDEWLKQIKEEMNDNETR